jgi:hypothetical protein
MVQITEAVFSCECDDDAGGYHTIKISEQIDSMTGRLFWRVEHTRVTSIRPVDFNTFDDYLRDLAEVTMRTLRLEENNGDE